MSDLTWTAKHCSDRSCWHLACSDGTWFSVPTQGRAEWMARALNRDHLFDELVAACEALPDFDIESPDAADFKDHASDFIRAMRLARAVLAKVATPDDAPAERMAAADLDHASRTWNQPEDGMRADDAGANEGKGSQ